MGPRRSWLRVGVRVLVGAWLFAATAALAAEQRYLLLLDADNNPTTGCTVAAGASSAPGIEVVLTTVVNTSVSSVNVVRLERQNCVGGVLGSAVVYSGGGWPVGLGNGSGGAAVVESFAPLAGLPGGQYRAWAVGIDSLGSVDWTSSFSFAVAPAGSLRVLPVPISPWLLLPLALLLFGAGVWLRRPTPTSSGSMCSRTRRTCTCASTRWCRRTRRSTRRRRSAPGRTRRSRCRRWRT